MDLIIMELKRKYEIPITIKFIWKGKFLEEGADYEKPDSIAKEMYWMN